MYPLPSKCPVCDDVLYIERLVCGQCGTVIEGTFAPQRFAQLTHEQWQFVTLFIRCEGKFTRMQEELGVSYPTVRNRLHDVIRALGYDIGEIDPEEDTRHSLLDALARGEATVDQVLDALEKTA